MHISFWWLSELWCPSSPSFVCLFPLFHLGVGSSSSSFHVSHYFTLLQQRSEFTVSTAPWRLCRWSEDPEQAFWGWRREIYLWFQWNWETMLPSDLTWLAIILRKQTFLLFCYWIFFPHRSQQPKGCTLVLFNCVAICTSSFKNIFCHIS